MRINNRHWGMWLEAVYGAYFFGGGFGVGFPNKQPRWFELWSKWSGSQYKVFTTDLLEKGKKKLGNSFPCSSPTRTNAIHQIAYIFWRMFGTIYSIQIVLHAKIKWDWICLLVEKAMAPHSSALAWKIPGTEEPGGLQSMGSLRAGHDWVTSLSLLTFMRWWRKWQPTPVFLPGVSQGRGSLVGCRLWGRTELDMTEVTWQQQ